MSLQGHFGTWEWVAWGEVIARPAVRGTTIAGMTTDSEVDVYEKMAGSYRKVIKGPGPKLSPGELEDPIA